MVPRPTPGAACRLAEVQRQTRVLLCAARTLKCHRLTPGHSIAAARELKSSLLAAAGGKEAELRLKRFSYLWHCQRGGGNASTPRACAPFLPRCGGALFLPRGVHPSSSRMHRSRARCLPENKRCALARATATSSRPWTRAWHGPSRAQSASRSLRRALLMPPVNTGSLYRCGKRTFKRAACGLRQEVRGGKGAEIRPKR